MEQKNNPLTLPIELQNKLKKVENTTFSNHRNVKNNLSKQSE